jgi:hypothetical protein
MNSILLTTSKNDREFSTNTNGSSLVEIKSNLLSGQAMDGQKEINFSAPCSL